MRGWNASAFAFIGVGWLPVQTAGGFGSVGGVLQEAFRGIGSRYQCKTAIYPTGVQQLSIAYTRVVIGDLCIPSVKSSRIPPPRRFPYELFSSRTICFGCSEYTGTEEVSWCLSRPVLST